MSGVNASLSPFFQVGVERPEKGNELFLSKVLRLQEVGLKVLFTSLRSEIL